MDKESTNNVEISSDMKSVWDSPYIYPLFWLHGEPFSVLENEVREMHKAGLRGFIVESRPFPDYMGKSWWETLHFLLDLAEELKMKVMLFDDSHFPSGYADGIIAKKYPEYLRLLIEMKNKEFIHQGGYFQFIPNDFIAENDKFIRKAYLLKKIADNTFQADSMIELPVSGGTVELPPGEWILNIWVVTRNGGEPHTRNYIHMLSKEAVNCYIQVVYQKHVEELKRHIGKSFVGFFSDEPRIANLDSYQAILGETKMPLPYSEELYLEDLPFLTMRSDQPERNKNARYRFMDEVSTLYSEAFPQQIGAFCKKYGLLYIGHVIEDNGAHCRLGYGNGHFFRSMEGQSWAGIDTVLGQNRPDHTEGILSSAFGQYNCEFFHYSLMKLASSCGELNEIPAFAEIFGAYGWSEDLAMMKWHTDHAIVRGINRLVPHAFSPKYPDPDCPPHFFARGKNAQWKYFHLWREYADLLCNLHSGGSAVSYAAVLYHAEAEWQNSNCIKCEAVMKRLIRQQIDPLIVPLDRLEDVTVTNGRGAIGKASFKILFVSDFELISVHGKNNIASLEKQGVKVFRVTKENIDLVTSADYCRECIDFAVEDLSPSLAVRHYKTEKTESYFLVNESLKSCIRSRIISDVKEFLWFDPLQKTKKLPSETLELYPGESLLLLRGEIPELLQHAEMEKSFHPEGGIQKIQSDDFDVICNEIAQSTLPSKTFSGTAVFSKSIVVAGKQIQFRFPEIKGCAVITMQVNGTEAGTRIAPPYHFQLNNLIPGSKLELSFCFTTTPAPEFRDYIFDKDSPFPEGFWNWTMEIVKGKIS